MVVVEGVGDIAEQRYRPRKPAQVFDILSCRANHLLPFQLLKVDQKRMDIEKKSKPQELQTKVRYTKEPPDYTAGCSPASHRNGVQQIFTRNLDRFLEDQICFSNQRSSLLNRENVLEKEMCKCNTRFEPRINKMAIKSATQNDSSVLILQYPTFLTRAQRIDTLRLA